MSDDIERSLSGANLARYQEFCRKHPWYREAQHMLKGWSNKVQEARKTGQNLENLFENEPDITVEDEIEFAKATLAQPDVLWYLQDFVKRTKDNPDADPHPDFVHITGTFREWYFFKKGHPHIRNILIGTRAVLLMYLRGEISSIDGEDAIEVAERFRIRSKSSKIKREGVA